MLISIQHLVPIHPSIAISNYNWIVLKDISVSDHFSIVLGNTQANIENPPLLEITRGKLDEIQKINIIKKLD